MVAGPKRSLPTRAIMKTSAPQSRDATAWFAPLPPNPRSNFWPKIVSPAWGKRSEKVVRSMFALPITAMRGRFAIGWQSLSPQSQREQKKHTKQVFSVALCLCGRRSLAIGNPDVFDLRSVLQKPSAFALLYVEPVDGATLVGENLL